MTAGIIVAYDKSSFTVEDRRTLEEIRPYISAIKIGLEAMTAEDSVSRRTIAQEVRDFAILNVIDAMWDMKLNDIGTTVAAAARNIIQSQCSMFTLHSTISDNGLELVANEAASAAAIPLAVTVLTDLDEPQCWSRFGDEPNNTVLRFLENNKKYGIRGLVCSPLELPYLRDVGALVGVTTVIPGIRPTWASSNDQKRVMTPLEAARAGADYIVVGRPILQPPAKIGSPEIAAKLIFDEIRSA